MSTIIGHKRGDVIAMNNQAYKPDESRFYNNTGDGRVSDAIIIAEGLLNPNSKLMSAVRAKNDFKYDSGRGDHVANELLAPCPIMRVNVYYPWYRWSRAIGYSDGKHIYINGYKLKSLALKDLVGNLVHEYAHACRGKFHHGNNYKTEDKVKFSVPYFLSENVHLWANIPD